MFGRDIPRFGAWQEYKKLNFEQSVESRIMELKRLFEETHEEASNSIVLAQEKKVKNQNMRSNASHDNLKIGDSVYLKDCRLIRDKFDPKFNGPFTISGQCESGNYRISTEKGELPHTYLRWKL